MHNWGVALIRVTPFFKLKIENGKLKMENWLIAVGS